jgi:hypothetical protein
VKRLERYLVFMVILLMACASPATAENMIPTRQPSLHAPGLVSLEIDFSNGTTIGFADVNGTNVLNATLSVARVVVQWYGNLAYVVEMDGVENVPVLGFYWQYWVNGDFASLAANLMPVSNGDAIVWRGVSLSFTASTPTQVDSGLIWGTIMTAISGAVFLGVLFAITRRRLMNEGLG